MKGSRTKGVEVRESARGGMKGEEVKGNSTVNCLRSTGRKGNGGKVERGKKNVE